MTFARGMDLSGARILIADGDDDCRESATRALSQSGFAIETCVDGGAALQRILRAPPDLVIADMVLPGRSGLDICRTMKTSSSLRLIPIILLTGLDETENRISGFEADADDYLIKPANPRLLLARSRSLLRLKRLHDELEYAEDVLFAMAAAVEAKDPFTKGHTERVSKLALKVGVAHSLPPEDIESLRKGAILHDIGKISIPDSLLNKDGRLTEEERQIMRGHTAVGYTICKPLRSLGKALDIVRHHHERLDGSGYPDGLKGEELSPVVRIMAAIDAFDALRSKRPYKEALPYKEVAQIMRRAVKENHLDKSIVEELLALGELLPPDVTTTPAIRREADAQAADLHGVRVRRQGAFTVVSPTGSLDLDSSEALIRALNPLIETPSPQVVLDLRDVTLLGSHALSIIVRIQDEIRRRHGRLVLGNPSIDVMGVLKMTNLDAILEIADDLNEILKHSEELRGELDRELDRVLDLPDGI